MVRKKYIFLSYYTIVSDTDRILSILVRSFHLRRQIGIIFSFFIESLIRTQKSSFIQIN